MSHRILIDTNVPMYAAGTDSPWKAPCAALLSAAASGRVESFASVEVFQEILHRYTRINRRADAFLVFDLFASVVEQILPTTMDVMTEARHLLEKVPELTSRDSIHAALALREDLVLVSYDRHFDHVPALKRVAPEQLAF